MRQDKKRVWCVACGYGGAVMTSCPHCGGQKMQDKSIHGRNGERKEKKNDRSNQD